MRQRRAVVAVISVLLLTGVFATPKPAGALAAFAGVCTVDSGSITFTPTLTLTPAATSASFNLVGRCTIATTSAAVNNVSFSIVGTIHQALPVMSCKAGTLAGPLKFWVDGVQFTTITTALVNVGGVLSISGASAQFAAAGELKSPTLGCPVSGSGWTGVVAVEDPTLDGTL